MNNIESAKGEIIMYQPDETIRLEVRVEDETVWLTQQQMAELFLTTKQNVSLHVNNIFREDELTESSVVKESLTTAKDGKRYKTKTYNLDVIISVGYRVKSKRGTMFRQWANRVLKEFIIRGYVLNQQLRSLEEKMETKFFDYDTKLRAMQNKIDFFVRTSLPPIEGIFYDGQIFDAYAQIVSLIRQAKHSIVLIDNYISVDTLTMLSNRDTNVSATIYTRQLSQQQQLDVQRHNQQYPPITINTCLHNHDRFLIVDDVVYLFGASLKDAGKKLFAYIRMQEASPGELLSMIR
ncbi:MAG: DNA-binding protein [Prevotella sp.]|nr:DNA-binding protein [Prevotella sp.]